MIFRREISKGIMLFKFLKDFPFLFSAHYLIMLYICTKFHENILNSTELWSGHENIKDGRAECTT